MAAEDYIHDGFRGMYDHDRVTVAYWLDDYEIVRTTEKALLVRDGEGAEEWLPKSQVHFEERAGVRCLYVESWLAEQKALNFHTEEFD